FRFVVGNDEYRAASGQRRATQRCNTLAGVWVVVDNVVERLVAGRRFLIASCRMQHPADDQSRGILRRDQPPLLRQPSHTRVNVEAVADAEISEGGTVGRGQKAGIT